MTTCACGDYHEARCPATRVLRNEWCTPKWLAELIGVVDIDPCSNMRSNICAHEFLAAELGANGLKHPTTPQMTAFINPPYANGQVLKWVRHWKETNFIFLLRWDPSTMWFAELMPECTHVWFPNRRIGFDPPPRIRASSNPYPHALYMRRPRTRGPDLLLARLTGYGFMFTAPATQAYTIVTRDGWKPVVEEYT